MKLSEQDYKVILRCLEKCLHSEPDLKKKHAIMEAIQALTAIGIQ